MMRPAVESDAMKSSDPKKGSQKLQPEKLADP
jgi:hypothetical protein